MIRCIVKKKLAAFLAAKKAAKKAAIRASRLEWHRKNAAVVE